MEYAEFLSLLSHTKRNWFMEPFGAIRTPGGPPEHECPISTLAHLSATKMQAAARQLALDIRLWDQIAAAADNRWGHDPAIRADLLAACGLTRKS